MLRFPQKQILRIAYPIPLSRDGAPNALWLRMTHFSLGQPRRRTQDAIALRASHSHAAKDDTFSSRRAESVVALEDDLFAVPAVAG